MHIYIKHALALAGAAVAAAVIAGTIIYVGSPAGFEQREVFSTKVKTFRITAINPPKHFRLSFQNVATGERFENVNISKHCNRWREVKIGDEWDIREVTYVYPKAQIYQTRLEGVKAICPRS